MVAPSIVRQAGPADKNEIWRLFFGSYRENAKFGVAPEKVEWFVNRALYPELIPEWDNGLRSVIGVIGDVGLLEGVCFITIGTYWYTHDRHIEEFLVYVDPECRRSDHARALVSWMKEQSDKSGLPLLTGIISSHRTEAKVRLYRRMLEPVGAFFLYGPKGATSTSSAAFA